MLLDEEKREPYRKYVWDIFMPKEQKTSCKTKDGEYDDIERTCKITVAYSRKA
jgi:hypothetical protein